jgi:hypothetical protein
MVVIAPGNRQRAGVVEGPSCGQIAKLEAQQRRVRGQIERFRAGDRLDRDEQTKATLANELLRARDIGLSVQVLQDFLVLCCLAHKVCGLVVRCV